MLKVSSNKPSAPAVPEMPADPMMGGEMPQAPEVPEIPEDVPMGNEEMPEEPMTGEGEEGGDDSTMSIINKLSDEDREAVRSYAESMLSKHGGEENGEEEMGEQPTEEVPPIPECKRFTKKQLKEEFGVGSEDEEIQKPDMKRKTIKRDNPFNPPKFN